MQTASERRMSVGLLIMRVGIALSQFVYALPRIVDGRGAWTVVGREMRFLHADFSAQVMGLILLAVEILAAVGLLTGYLFRVSALLLTAVYGLYFFNFIHLGYKTLPLYAGALACVCIGLLLSGPGRFAVAVKIESK
jgi:hypothetical protein